MKIVNETDFDMLINVLDVGNIETDKIKDSILNRFWRYIQILELYESDILKKIDSVNCEDLFYSRYYWFNQFTKRFFSIYGHDEGLKQQSFKMLENYEELFGAKIDWNIIEQIENGYI